MSSENDKPFDLRDRLALEMLTLILNLSKKPNDLYRTYREYMDYDYTNRPDDFIESVKRASLNDREYSDQEFTKYVRQAYHMANIIRKVRLGAFE